jgi:hypothetical protein
MPAGLGFDVGYHVIIFFNPLMFIDQDKLEYQVKYPLTGGNKREGVLAKHTMRDVIDASIERGMSLRLSVREKRFPPHRTNATMYKKGKSVIFISGAFTQLTTIQV